MQGGLILQLNLTQVAKDVNMFDMNQFLLYYQTNQKPLC